MAKAKEGFVFYPSFFDAYKAAKAIQKDREYIDAMLGFAFEGRTPKIDDDDIMLKALVSAFVPQIEANQKKREAGHRGGRPKKEQPMVSDKEQPMVSGKE